MNYSNASCKTCPRHKLYHNFRELREPHQHIEHHGSSVVLVHRPLADYWLRRLIRRPQYELIHGASESQHRRRHTGQSAPPALP